MRKVMAHTVRPLGTAGSGPGLWGRGGAPRVGGSGWSSPEPGGSARRRAPAASTRAGSSALSCLGWGDGNWRGLQRGTLAGVESALAGRGSGTRVAGRCGAADPCFPAG